MKLEISGAIFDKYSKPNSMTFRPLGAELLHADGQANRYMKLILGSCSFANSPKMCANESCFVQFYRVHYVIKVLIVLVTKALFTLIRT